MAVGFWKKLFAPIYRLWDDHDARRIQEFEQQIAQLRQTEQILRAEQDFLKLVAKAARIDTWVWDRHTDVLSYPNADPLRAQRLPKSFNQFLKSVPPEDHQRLRAMLARSLEERIPYEVEYRSLRLDGQMNWYYNTGNVHYDANGEVDGLIGITLNINQLKKAEERLKTSEAMAHAFQEKLKALHAVTIELAQTDSLDDFYRKAVELGRERLEFDRLGLFIIDPDNHNRALGTYGTDRYGNTFDERHTSFLLNYEFTVQISKSNRWNMVVHDDHDLREGDEIVGHGWNILTMLWNEDNPTGWLAADNLLRQEPLTDQHLELLSLYASMLGALLLKKQAELETQRHQERLRLALQAGRLRVWEWKRGADELLYHQELNSERPIFPTFSSIMQYVVPEDVEAVQRIKTLCFDQGVPVQTEFRILLPGHNLRWLFALGHPYRDESGEVAGIIGVTQDITERKEAAERGLELALQKERISLMTEFLSNITHDMKTPLSVMNTSLYLLEQTDEPEMRARKIETIREQAALMERFIQDMLTISRLDYAPAFEMKPVDINDLLREVQARLLPAAEHRHLSLSLNLSEQIPPVLGDPSELNRMLVNLVENAVQYTPPDGSIVVHTQFEDEAVIIDVTDTGMGIADTELPMIFGRFYRADSARKSRQGGTGLGLAIVKRIVEIHQGEISVNSQIGKGTTFHLRLPIAHTAISV